MIRTFIADDEPLILRSIRKSIEETNPMFRIVGQAMDGQTAFRLIQELKPEVIFTDIRMPVIDGLTLIKQLREAGNQATIVLLSGYKEFEYAKEAIRLSVVDYLIKPINPEMLRSILTEIEDKWSRELKQRQMDYLENPGEPAEPGRLFPPGKTYWAVQVCIGVHGQHSSEPLGSRLNNRINFSELVPRIAAGCECWIMNGKQVNETLLLFAADGSLPRTEVVQQLYGEISRQLFRATAVTIVGSHEFCEITEFQAQAAELEVQLAERTLFAQSLLIGEVQPLTEPPAKLPVEHTDKLNLLRTLLSKKKWTDSKLLLRNLLLMCEQEGCSQLLLAKLLKKVCFIWIQVTELELEVHEFVSVLIGSSNDYGDLYRNFAAAFDEIMEPGGARKPAQADNEVLVDEIQAYLDQFYTTDQSVQEIAGHFGFNYSYFCSLFKRYKQKSPNEYMIEKRIEMAKKLMLTSDLNIKSIAAVVGYEDPYYFSRIFKTVAGVTPSRYRKSISGSA